MQKVKIVLVGGGTGGHFYPLIAIAESLNAGALQPDLYYAGPTPYNADALEKNSIRYVRIPAGKRRKYTSLLNIVDFFKTLFGVCIAVVKLYVIYPDVIMSKGGYTSLPVVLAAFFLRIPIVVHESDAKIGTANRIALKLARHVVVSYTELMETLTHPRVHLLGIPIRRALLAPPTETAIETLGIDGSRPLILVIGGSQGAERINRLILDSLDELLPTYSIIHQTGAATFEQIKLAGDTLITDTNLKQHYRPYPSLTETQINDAYHLAQIIITRAGSNSLYEIALHGKPSIIIPIPEEISHDQRTNAYAYASTGAGVVIEEKNMSDSLLRAEIDRIMQNAELYSQMSSAARSFGKTDASDRIADLITEIAQNH